MAMDGTAGKTATARAGLGTVAAATACLLAATFGGLAYAVSALPPSPVDSAEGGRYLAETLVAHVGALRDAAVERADADRKAFPLGPVSVLVEAQRQDPAAPGHVDVAVAHVTAATCRGIGRAVGMGRPAAAVSVNGSGFVSGDGAGADSCIRDIRGKHFRARNLLVIRVERGPSGG
jgi:hypothetical protein